MVDKTQPAIENHGSRKRPGLGILAGAVLLTGAFIVTASIAAFSDTTDNTGNTWSTGTVILEDNDLGAAMFTVTGMKPLDVVEKCIVVTYKGTLLPADVLLYGVSGGSGLDAYLDLVIDEGTGAAFGNCSGFSFTSNIFTGTLTSFAATHTNFGDGAGIWSPSANPESKTYRFTVTLQDDNAAQTLDATAEFTWEAQNQ
ncbi:MAG: hypothetical protein IIC72_12875 [Acidobacteria bacterium]|nr:hypothetical protein [Acidobacteriota bacterium]